MHTASDTETLTDEQRDVIAAAAQNRGLIEIATKFDTKGRAIRAGRVKLYQPEDPEYAKRCCDSVPQLLELQLIRDAQGLNQYELTNYGWQLSRRLTTQPAEDITKTQPIPSGDGHALQAESINPESPGSIFGDDEPIAEPGSPVNSTMPLPNAGPRPEEDENPSEEPEYVGMGTMPLSGAADREQEYNPSQEDSRDDQAPSDGLEPSMTMRLSPEGGVYEPQDTSDDNHHPTSDEGGLRHPGEYEADLERASSLISALGLDDGFHPDEPRTLEETGLNRTTVEELILKVIQNSGSLSGRELSNKICLPLAVLDERFDDLRKRQLITPAGQAMLGDNVYQLTDMGRDRARQALAECAYAGPAPVPLDDYIDSVQAQTIRTEKPKRDRLEQAFSDINVEPEMLAQLGPAVSAGKGMFVYGPPGNGKTTIAQRITRCFGQSILVPHALIEDGQIIKFFDASCHELEDSVESESILSSDSDRRWVRIRRPTVVVGGELTMDNLELKHDPISHVSEASLQLKSNCGSLLIDDFGRQRVNPTELLNRWIIPLENRIDFLTLANGKKVEVPFEQLIIFSTNLEPSDLADDAFLRRIPFKIEVGAPSLEEFIKLFGIFASKLGVECPQEEVVSLLERHYQPISRPYRRCQARDLLDQVLHYCEYNDIPVVANQNTLDHAVKNYFTAMAGTE